MCPERAVFVYDCRQNNDNTYLTVCLSSTCCLFYNMNTFLSSFELMFVIFFVSVSALSNMWDLPWM